MSLFLYVAGLTNYEWYVSTADGKLSLNIREVITTNEQYKNIWLAGNLN
jgi:hypothetical protein